MNINRKLTVFILLAIFCLNINSEGLKDIKWEKLLKDLNKFLTATIEKDSGRKNVKIDIVKKIEGKSITVELDKRSQRETIFYLKLTDIDKYIGLELITYSQNQNKIIKKILKDFLSREFILSKEKFGCIGLGIVNISYAPVYVDPIKKAGGNLATELLYGFPIVLLGHTKDKNFFHIKNLEDGYVGWIEKDKFKLVSEKEWKDWAYSSHIYLNDKKVLNGMTFYPGSFFKLNSKNKPINLEGTVCNITWNMSKKVDRKTILRTAKRFLPKGNLGPIVYLWGGLHIPKLDCSGFTHLVYRINNIIIPRDSDQQLQFSTPVKREEMKPGDLIFFSKHRKHPTHVGIYLGNGKYIHCSPSGEYSGVKINSLKGKSKYDKFLNSIYYASGRILKD